MCVCKVQPFVRLAGDDEDLMNGMSEEEQDESESVHASEDEANEKASDLNKKTGLHELEHEALPSAHATKVLILDLFIFCV